MKTLLVMLIAGWATQVAGDNSVVAPAVPCHSVDDCWIDASGNPIRRPKRYRGKPIPRGDCGSHLNWLRSHLYCDQGRCVSFQMADRC